MNVVDFFEAWGQDAGLRHADAAALTQALARSAIDPFARKAILAADQRHLEFLLGARANVCCLVNVPKGDEDREEMPKKAGEDSKERAA
jgi:hypothetical protein